MCRAWGVPSLWPPFANLSRTFGGCEALLGPTLIRTRRDDLRLDRDLRTRPVVEAGQRFLVLPIGARFARRRVNRPSYAVAVDTHPQAFDAVRLGGRCASGRTGSTCSPTESVKWRSRSCSWRHLLAGHESSGHANSEPSGVTVNLHVHRPGRGISHLSGE